jgi:polyphosphate kinase 2 (PPK2 family)
MRTADKAMKRKEYDKELRTLQIELCALQDWVREKGLRVIVVFEGRDAAGKGGAIRAITERVSPRVFRVAALPAPSDREKSQLYVQRFVDRSMQDAYDDRATLEGKRVVEARY